MRSPQHRDAHAGAGWEAESIGHGVAERTVKAFIYMNDVAADQGPASVVRGSHRISQLGVTPAGLFDFASGGFRAHREHADQKEAAQAPFTGRGAGNTESNGFAPLDAIPNHVKFVARAGDCIVFE